MKNPSMPYVKCSRLAMASVCFALFAHAAVAATSCNFNGVVAVNFGAYDVFSVVANDNGVGSLSIHCRGGYASSYSVTLGTGQSHRYTSRVLRSRAGSLYYNLYTSATRNLVWGDGSGGSGVMAAAKNSQTTLSIFGQIPAGQDVAAGVYSDSIIATINF